MINCSKPSTFPSPIKDIVIQYIEENLLNIGLETQICNIKYDNDVQCILDKHLLPCKAERLYTAVLNELQKSTFELYHATKTLSVQKIRDEGLRTNDWVFYSDYIMNTLIQLGIIKDDLDLAISYIQSEYNRKYSKKSPQLCFFSSLELASTDDMSGYDQFYESIGGELARWALEDKLPRVYRKLKAQGVPIIVAFSLSFFDIADYQKEGIAYQFICHFAAKYFWDYNYKILFDGATYNNIAPNKIINIILDKTRCIHDSNGC